MTDVLSMAPPSRANLYVEIGAGHFVFYRDYADKVYLMEKRRQQAAHAKGVSILNTGETLDMFQVMA